jgi:hypothetical protein
MGRHSFIAADYKGAHEVPPGQELARRANGKVCATCKGTFVVVREGHQAFHRW